MEWQLAMPAAAGKANISTQVPVCDAHRLTFPERRAVKEV